jgi:hypothetical protein
MEIQLGEQRIFALEERLSFDDIRQRAMDRRTQAFGSGLGSLLQRPRADDIALVAWQRRLDPFWHVACQARYVYERTRDYAVPASAPEVREVTIGDATYPVQASGRGTLFTVPVREHCREEFWHEIFADGATGAPVPDAAAVITGPNTPVTDPAALGAEGTIVVPPEHRASFVVRKLLGEMLKAVQADTVSEESLTLEKTDLYYRPVWAFEFHWAPRDRRGVVEIDALTGQTRQGQTLLPAGLKKMMSRDMLFDIGADTAGLIVPGGSIAVKVAKAALDKRG